MNQVEYAGAKLRVGPAVLLEGPLLGPGRQVSGWSEPATWGMGLRPVRVAGQVDRAPRRRPRRTRPAPRRWSARPSSLDGQVKRAIAYASALGLYELHINGQRVGDQVLAPEWTDYNKRVQYQTYDVTGLLQAGENAVGAMLGDGWYAGRVGISHIVKDGPVRHLYGERPRLLVQLEVELADGRTQIVVTDGTWKDTTDGPIRKADILDGEVYDARREMPGWDTAGFDDAAWRPVDVLDKAKGRLVAQPNEPIRVTKEVRPVTVTEPKPGVYVFDLGQNLAGWCRLKVREPAGTIDPPAPRRDAQRGRHDLPRQPADAQGRRPAGGAAGGPVHRRGGGEEVFEPHFTYHGFRYVEVTGLTGQADARHADRPARSTRPPPEAGSFECSSPMLNQLMPNIVWTQRDNMHSVPTDCPQRDERLGWMGDMLVFGQTAMFNMDMAAFFTKWVRGHPRRPGRRRPLPGLRPAPVRPERAVLRRAGLGRCGRGRALADVA